MTCLDEEPRLSRSRTMNPQRLSLTPTVQKPKRAKSLLVDYSKSRVLEDELKPLDQLLPLSLPVFNPDNNNHNAHHNNSSSSEEDNHEESDDESLPGSLMPGLSSMGASNNSQKERAFYSEQASLTTLVAQGGGRSYAQKCIQEDNEMSNSSFALPELSPMEQTSTHQPIQQQQQQQQPGLLLGGKSEHTDCHSEDEDSFHNSFAYEELIMSPTPTTQKPTARPTSAKSRRQTLASTRGIQSASSLLSPKGKQQRPSLWVSPKASGSKQRPPSLAEQRDMLSFSLRRRPSERRRQTPDRNKTWDEEQAESTMQRFHQSLSQMDMDPKDFLLDSPTQKEEKDNTSNHTNTRPVATISTNPAQCRRSKMVRHSSVSALESHSTHLPVTAPPAAGAAKALSPMISSHSTRGTTIFPKKAPAVRPESIDISITPKSNRRGLMEESGRRASARTLGTASVRGETTSSRRGLMEESGRRASARNLGRSSTIGHTHGPSRSRLEEFGRPDSSRALGRASTSTGMSSNRRGGMVDESLGRRNSSRNLGRASFHGTSTISSGRTHIPGDSNTGLRRNSNHTSTKTPPPPTSQNRNGTSSGRRLRASRTLPNYQDEAFQRLNASSSSFFSNHTAFSNHTTVTDLTASPTNGTRHSRRDVLARQLGTTGGGSRRHVMSDASLQRRRSSINMAGFGGDGGDDMDTSGSHFVTGSRIRRGTSCRHLVC